MKILDIIVVEDDLAHSEAVRRSLSDSTLNCNVSVAKSLLQYREMSATNPPDLAIMDLNLPDGRSVDLLTHPAEDGPFPILLMTSYGNEHIAVEAIKGGAIDYIVKSPEAFAQLPRIVESALREWKLLCDHKKAVQDIKDSEYRFHTLTNQFNTLLDTLPDRIILHDTELRVIWANQAATAELGRNASELIGQHCFTLWHDRSVPCDHCPVDRAIKTGNASIENITTADGRTWELRSIPVKEKGRIVSLIEVSRDITEQRLLEEKLRQSQKMDAVGRLAGGVAHDFNNMLNAILGYCELALQRCVNDEKTSIYLKEVLKAGARSSDLTRQLLAFSRKQVVEPRVMDLNQVISEQLKFFSKLIGEDIDLVFIPEKDSGLVLMDPSQVDQILLNLIVNARDAISGNGRITIEIKLENLDDAYCRKYLGTKPGEYVRLTISDNGSGMDSHTLERIFEPFFSTKEKQKGTGLGLATVYGIVTQNNGEIHAESEVGKGSTFVIHFPRVRSEEIKTLSTVSNELPRGTETILVVEDDEQNLDITRILLEECGYTVIATTSPLDACNLFNKYMNSISLVISDVVMPHLNGRELYSRLSSLKPDIKVLFMSGYTDDVITNRGVLPEGTKFIHKPFSIQKLASKVRTVLDTVQ